MEIKAHYKGRRLRKGGTKIKTKQQPKKGKERKNDERKKLKRQNSEVERLELMRLLKKI